MTTLTDAKELLDQPVGTFPVVITVDQWNGLRRALYGLERVVDEVHELADGFTKHPDARVVRRGEALLALVATVHDA